MATKFDSGYVSKYLVDWWTSPSDRPSPFRTCGQPVDNPSGCLPPDHILQPLSHKVHKGCNNQIIFDTKKIHEHQNPPPFSPIATR